MQVILSVELLSTAYLMSDFAASAELGDAMTISTASSKVHTSHSYGG